METNREIINEATKRFKQIVEYTTIRHNLVGEDNEYQDLNEADDEETAEPNAASNTAQSADSNMQGQEPMPQDDGFDPQVDDNAGGMGGDADMAFDNAEDVSEMQPDDEVIDISDLTDSQEETEDEVRKLGGKFGALLKRIDKFAKMVQDTDDKIKDLKAEIEKRNPTPIEKLEMRSMSSYPYNIKPNEYWEEKEKNSNYRVVPDDKKEEYTITQNDLNSGFDPKTLSDSFSKFDIMNQTMKNTMPRY